LDLGNRLLTINYWRVYPPSVRRVYPPSVRRVYPPLFWLAVFGKMKVNSIYVKVFSKSLGFERVFKSPEGVYGVDGCEGGDLLIHKLHPREIEKQNAFHWASIAGSSRGG